MSVSPADAPKALPSLRLLDRLHVVELATINPELVRQHLLTLFQEQRALGRAHVQALTPAEYPRVLQLLGDELPTTTLWAEGAAQSYEKQVELNEQLSRNYETAHKEMLQLGRTALVNAALFIGRERVEELRDAQRLLRGILDHPVGGRNYAVWFELGWVLVQLEAPLPECEEAFYQAARLAFTARDHYYSHALRHLAHVQANQGHGAAAWETIQRCLALSDEPQPALLLEAARCALGIGEQAQAESLLHQALDLDPVLADSVFADPELAPLYSAALTQLEQFTQVARSIADTSLQRLQFARATEKHVQTETGLTISLPPISALPLTAAQCSLFESHKLAIQADREALQLFDIAIDEVSKALVKAQEEVRRFKLQIDQALSEKAYWEGSVRNIEAEAKAQGYPLHPYTFNNPFLRKRNQRAEQARLLYEQVKQNLDRVEKFLVDHLPAMQQNYDGLDHQRQKIGETLEWLRTQRGKG